MTRVMYKTDQEAFWSGAFGDEYIGRNDSQELLASNLNFFTKALKSAGRVASCIEFGANIGMNLRALKLLYPHMQQYGIEINEAAASGLKQFVGQDNVFTGTIYDYPAQRTFDLALIKGVLIHINPDMLKNVYQKLYQSSERYILVCEYYNPSPVTIPYRGHMDRLFKRDFCGEMLEQFPDLKLVDYGFAYKRDTAFPQDDITWFLMKKDA